MSDRHDEHDANYSGTVIKALDILACLADHQHPMTAQAIAKACSISRPTAYRLLATLGSRGFVRTDGNYQYSLGTRLLSLGRIVLNSIDLPELARPYLFELCSISNETANLSIMDETELLYIGKEESLHTAQKQVFVNMRSDVGTRIMPHCSAMGKAILAYLSPTALDALLQKSLPLKVYTAHTIIDPEVLQHELVQIRQQGYAIDDREVDDGTRCVAAPIFDNSGQVAAAMSIAGPTYRLKLDRLHELSPEVRRVALALSRQLGYTG